MHSYYSNDKRENNSTQCFVLPLATLMNDNLMKTSIHNISLNVDNSDIWCGIMKYLTEIILPKWSTFSTTISLKGITLHKFVQIWLFPLKVFRRCKGCTCFLSWSHWWDIVCTRSFVTWVLTESQNLNIELIRAFCEASLAKSNPLDHRHERNTHAVKKPLTGETHFYSTLWP